MDRTAHETIRSTARWLAVLALLLVPAFAGAQETVDPDDDGSQWAWAENIGWINFEPEGDGGSGVDTTRDDETDIHDWTGWLWAENAGWISLACENTGTCGDVDYGVNVVTDVMDPFVELRGWAWGENVGWISWACESTGTCGDVDYGVEIEVPSGDLLGWAWGENVGWISMSCENTGTCGDVAYGVTVGPCPVITSFTTNPVEMGVPVVINGMDLADPGNPIKPRVFFDDLMEAPAVQITAYTETTINWNQMLAVGAHPIRVQHQNGCLSDPVVLTVIPPSSSSAANCGLLGIEALPLLAGLALLRRRRAVTLERNR